MKNLLLAIFVLIMIRVEPPPQFMPVQPGSVDEYNMRRYGTVCNCHICQARRRAMGLYVPRAPK